MRSAGASASTATRTWDNQRRPLPALPHRESSLMWKPIAVPKLTAGVALRPPLYYMVGVEQGASSAVALAPAEISVETHA